MERNGTKKYKVLVKRRWFIDSTIESYWHNYYFYNPLMKCFTFLSHLKKEFRSIDIDLIRISTKVLPKPHWHSVNPLTYIAVVMHSPNTLPEMNKVNVVKIEMHRLNDIRFSQTEVEMLGKGYDTNCHNYDLDYKYGNFNMRSDCMTHCYYNYIMKKCDYGDKIPGSTFLLREDTLEYMNGTIGADKNGYEANDHPAYEYCSSFCRPDCNFSYYIYEHEPGPSHTQYLPQFDLRISHNSFPDIVIKYLPKTTFISFVCSFGGLLGMWLGLSFLTILDEGKRVLVSFIKRQINYPNPSIQFNFFVKPDKYFQAKNKSFIKPLSNRSQKNLW